MTDSHIQEQLIFYARDLARIYEAEKQKRRHLEIANQKLRATLEGIKDGVVTLDDKLTIVEANHSFAEIIGVPMDDCVDRPLTECLSKGWSPLSQALKQAAQRQEMLLNPDGNREHFYRVICSPIFRNRSQFHGWVISLRDETTQQKSNIVKDQFLSLVGHELETPLQIIPQTLQLLESMLGNRLEEREHQLFRSLEKTSEKLCAKFREIIDAAQLASKISEEREHFDLKAEISKLQQRRLPKLTENHSEIRIDLPDHPCEVYGYPKLINQALSYLIEHVAPTASSQSMIRFILRRQDDRWHLTVTTSGYPGANAAMVATTAEPTMDSLTAHLGLSIVKKIALLHGGDFHLELNKTIFILPAVNRDQEEPSEAKLHDLQKQLTLLQEQNLQYARDLALTYTNKKKMSTRLQKTEEQLVRSEKLALMGQMAAGFVHEVNNTLAPITVYSYMLLQKNSELSPVFLRQIQTIHDCAWKALNMLRQMLDFSRQESKQFEAVDVIQLLENDQQMLQYRFRKGKVKVQKDYRQDKIMVMGNPGHLDQVFINLMINAIDAMVQGGTLTISVRASQQDQNGQSVPVAKICFQDTGPGIAAVNYENIFAPFFSTKDKGKGTGLGLYISHEIIEKHGGVIAVESEVGHGAKFIIKLPLAQTT